MLSRPCFKFFQYVSTVSASGKLLAHASDEAVSLFDVERGVKLGETEVKGPPDERGGFSNTVVAFSPDGTKLAVAQWSNDKLRIKVLSVANGGLEKVKDCKLTEQPAQTENSSIDGQRLSWNLDNTMLLWGDLVVDAATLLPAWRLQRKGGCGYHVASDFFGALRRRRRLLKRANPKPTILAVPWMAQQIAFI